MTARRKKKVGTLTRMRQLKSNLTSLPSGQEPGSVEFLEKEGVQSPQIQKAPENNEKSLNQNAQSPQPEGPEAQLGEQTQDKVRKAG